MLKEIVFTSVIVPEQLGNVALTLTKEQNGYAIWIFHWQRGTEFQKFYSNEQFGLDKVMENTKEVIRMLKEQYAKKQETEKQNTKEE